MEVEEIRERVVKHITTVTDPGRTRKRGSSSKSAWQPVIVPPNIYYKLLASLFNKVDFFIRRSSTSSILLPSLTMKFILWLGLGPLTHLSLQSVYPNRGLKYAPLSEPPRREYERTSVLRTPGKCLASTASVETEGMAPSGQTHCTQ